MFEALSSPLQSQQTKKIRPHWGLQNVSKSWLPFEFVVFLYGAHTRPCIPGDVYLRMSRRKKENGKSEDFKYVKRATDRTYT
jgi:hypothetical protein